MGFLEWYDARNKKNTSKVTESEDNTTSSKGFLEWYDARNGKYELSKTIGFDTINDDLTSLAETINSAHDTWQTPETMANTKASIQGMYERLGKAQEYFTQYGGADVTELRDSYKSVLDNWDDLSYTYSGYKNADEWNKAVETSKAMKTDNLVEKKAEIIELESSLRNAQKLKDNVTRLEARKQYAGRMPNMPSVTDEELEGAKKELQDLLSGLGYSDYDALKKAVGEKNTYYNNASRTQNLIKMTTVGDVNSENYDKDYDKYVESGKNVPAEEVGESKLVYQTGRGHSVSREINSDLREAVLAAERRKKGETSTNSDNYHDKGALFDNMTDKEFNDLYYYIGKDKEDGGNRAEEYVEGIKESVSSRRSKEIAEMVKERPWGEAEFSVLAGLDQFAEGVKANFSDEDYIPASPIQQASGRVRYNIEEDYGAFARGAYDLGVTGANMLPSILAGTAVSMIAPHIGLAGTAANIAKTIASSVPMFASARGSAYQEMLNLGYSKEQAEMYGSIVGASEVGLQALLGGISKLGTSVTGKRIEKLVSSIESGLARFAIQFPLSMASEVLEEGLQEVLTPMFKDIAAGYDTGAKVDWGEVAYSALLGGLMGGVFEGPTLAVNTARESIFNKATGANISANERVGDMLDLANNPEMATAYEAYTQYAKKGVNAGNISNAQLGRLHSNAVADANAILESKESTTEQKAKAEQILKDLGAYSLASPQSKTGSAKNLKKSYVKGAYDKESVIGLIGDGLESSEGTESHKLATEYMSKMGLTKEEVETINTKLLSGEKLTKEESTKIESIKNLKPAEITKLMDANDSAFRAEENEAIKKELVERGESPEVAEIAARKIRGEVLSTKEGEMLHESKYAQQYIAEQNNADNVTEELLAKAEAMPKEDAALFIALYNKNVDLDEYHTSFNLAAMKSEKNFSFEDISKTKGILTGEQIGRIYAEKRIQFDRGRVLELKKLSDKTASKKAYKSFINESVINYDDNDEAGRTNWKDLTTRQRRAITFMNAFAKGAGINLVWTNDINSPSNGYYNRSTNTIYLNIFAGIDGIKNFEDTIIPTASHELFHWMRMKAPDLYRSINNVAMPILVEEYSKKYGKTMSEEDVIEKEMDKLERDLIARERAKLEAKNPGKKFTKEEVLENISKETYDKNVNEDLAREELLARACEDLFAMGETGKKIFNSLNESEKKTLLEKIKDIIQDIIDWVNDFLGLYESSSTEAQMMRRHKEELQKLVKLYDEMLERSIEVNQALEKSGEYGRETSAEDNVLFCERSNYPSEFNPDGLTLRKQLEQAFDESESKERRYVYVGEFTQNFVDKLKKHIIIKKLPIVMNYRDAYLSMKSKEKGKYQGEGINYHNLGVDGLESALKSFDNPEYVLLSKNEGKIELILEGRDYKNRQLFSIVEVNTKAQYNREFLSAHVVTSVYGNRGLKNRIANAEVEGRIIYNKKEESTQGMPQVQYERDINVNSSTDIILNSSKDVKELFSNKDSLDRELSKGQMEYFKDSTVRDENGNLLVMYRGDSSDFTVFDRKKTKHSNLYGRGFYFTSSKAHAEQYGKSREFYLNIKNPLSPKHNAITKEQMLNFLKAIENDGEDYDLYNYGQGATAESVLDSVWGKGDFEMLQDVNASAIGDLVAAVELFNEVNGTSYDGIVLPTETVTFNSNQSKLTSNQNPTDNEDILFSMKDNVEETKDLVAVHNLSADKLLKSLQLGGLPMPSIAIVRAREGFNQFGEISMVFNKSTIDPSLLKSNMVFGSDAWTPTFPKVEYKLNTTEQEKIKKKIDALVPGNIKQDLGGLHLDSTNMEYELNRKGDMVSAYRYNYAMMYAFLKDNGVDFEFPTTEKLLSSRFDNDVIVEFAKKYGKDKIVEMQNYPNTSLVDGHIEEIKGIVDKYYSEKVGKDMDWKIDRNDVWDFIDGASKYLSDGIQQKIDYREARNIIDDNIDMAKYELWLKDLFSNVIAKKGIRNNKDLFTPSGNRRSFEALHYELTLENVVKKMIEEGTQGIGGWGNGNIIGGSAVKFNSIDELKNNASNRLQTIPPSEYEKIRKGLQDRFWEIAQGLDANSFSSAADLLVEAVVKFKTKSGMANYLRKESQGWAKYSDHIVDDLVELVNDIRNMPVDYFEAKPQRAIGFNEVKAVIMPEQSSFEDDLSEVRSELEKLGIPILEYEYGDNDARLDALNSLDEVLFNMKEGVTEESDDALHSERTYSYYDIMGERDRAIKERDEFKADAERLRERLAIEKKLTKGQYIDNNKALVAAGHIRHIANSTYDKVTLAREIRDIYSYIAESKESKYDALFRKCYEIADNVLREAKPEVVVNDYFKGILSELRTTRVRLDDMQKQEARHLFGNNYPRSFIGRIVIADDAKISLDSKWQELSTRYPEIFRADVNPNDQIGELYDILSTLQESSETISEYDKVERTKWLSHEIFNTFWNMPTVETTADKYDKRIKELRAEHKKAISNVRDYYKARIDAQKLADEIHYGKKMRDIRNERDKMLEEQRKADMERYRKLYDSLRERKDAEVKLAKEHGREMLESYKARAERKTYIESTLSTVMSLNRKLTTNSKDVHIPDSLKPVVINLLNSIDFSSKQLLGMSGTRKDSRGLPTKSDIATENALNKVHSMSSDAPSLFVAVQDALKLFEDAEKVMHENTDGTVDSSVVALDADIIDEIRNLVTALGIIQGEGNNAFVLEKMSLEHLKTLNAVVKSINHWAIVADKALANKHKMRISEAAMRTIEENDVLGERREYIEGIESVKKFFSWSNLLPVNAFKRLGKAAMGFFNALRDSQDKHTFNLQEVMDFTERLFKEHKDALKWSKDVRTFEVTLPHGEKKTVRMPVSYVMTLYCVSKQEDAKRHLYGQDASGNKLTYTDDKDIEHDGGGMTIKGFRDKGLKVSKDLDNTIINESIVNQITSVLTEEQRTVADELQNFMNTKGSEWGNAVSMALYGIKKFEVKDYFPLTVSPHSIGVDNTQEKRKSMFSIINYGFTKERNPKANQSIEIGDIFEIFANHMNMISVYNAYALSIYDIARWYKFKTKDNMRKEISVTKSIEKAFGNGATTYVSNLIRDLNGQHESSRLGFISHIFKNTKVAMVGNSLSVALLQPTAYIKAMTKISPKYLLKSALYVKDFGAKKGVEKAKKYCGIALLKSQGYFETGVSANTATKILHDESFREKAISASLKGAEFMDERTWGVLWNACEFEVRSNRKDLKVGSTEFYEVIGENLRDVIYETQVVDSPLTKSELMRSPDGLAKSITMFASEITVAYNMVVESAIETSLDIKRNGKQGAFKRNGKRVFMALTAYTLTSAANAILQTAVQAFRDDDEDKELEDYIKDYLVNFLTDWLIIGKVPYFKEALSMAQGYSSTRVETLWLQSAFKAYEYWGKAFDGKEGATMKAFDETLKTISYLSGFALFNQWRDLRALLRQLGIMD